MAITTDQQKILILSCNTGQGHNATAAAIKEEADRRHISCDSADALAFISSSGSKWLAVTHARVYRHIPSLFNHGYDAMGVINITTKEQKFVDTLIAHAYDRLEALIRKEHYTTVICVHVLSGVIAGRVQQRSDLSFSTCFVATDYTCSPLTADSKLDWYFIPHPDLIEEYVSRGVPREKIIASGIPVKDIFHTGLPRQQAKKQLLLPLDHRYVLLMCGSMGCGPMETLTIEISHVLPPDAELLVICGSNKHLLERLQKAKLPQVRPYGYRQDVPLLLDAADLFLTKSGGVSITEGASKGRDMLLVDAVEGCEQRNRKFFMDHAWAFSPDTDVAEAVRDYLDGKQEAITPFPLQHGAKVILNTMLAKDPATPAT